MSLAITHFIDLKSGRHFTTSFSLYIWQVFGIDWMNEQKSQPLEKSHQILKWYRAFRKLQRTQSQGKKEAIIEFSLNGATKALLSLAYDIFTIENNLHLPSRLLHRLQDAGQFQGARYELFCICALLRGGFSIEFEDETDGSTPHPELIATHLATKTRIAVEAKSKHRKGILGVLGNKIPDEKIRFGKIRQLLNDAVSKNVKMPLVIFLDVNLPPEKAKEFLISSTDKTLKVIESLPQSDDSYDLFSFVLFTNHPHHYGHDDEKDPYRIYSGRMPAKPKYPITESSIIDDIVSGSIKYGHVPQEFDSKP